MRLLEMVQTSARNRSISACKADRTSPYPVLKMCVLAGRLDLRFCYHCDAVETARQRRQAKIIIHVKTAFQAGRGAYGGGGCMRYCPTARNRRWPRAR